MTEFVEHLHEVFGEFGSIQVRRMFGGHGLFRHGLMFGLVAEDTVYLKADESSAVHFEEKGLEQFEYGRSGKRVKLSYFQAPDEIFDDPSEAAAWAGRAFDAAVRADRKPKRKSARSRRRK